jgi:hypothetical protein
VPFVPEMSVVGASKLVAGALAAVYDYKDPFPPRPRPSLHSTLYFNFVTALCPPGPTGPPKPLNHTV